MSVYKYADKGIIFYILNFIVQNDFIVQSVHWNNKFHWEFKNDKWPQASFFLPYIP